MKLLFGIGAICLFCSIPLPAQQQEKENLEIYKVPRTLLAGEGLNSIKQKDPERTVYQKKIYDGNELAMYIIAIGTGITNEFKSFPLEEFIFWMNGKAKIEPVGEEPFEIQTGDYFVQAKGFNGKWNFIDNGGLHLELSIIAKNRPNSTIKSPITRALVIGRDMISGVSQVTNDSEIVYRGAELNVNVIHSKSMKFENVEHEKAFHVLRGVMTITNRISNSEQDLYPGDFFVIPQGFQGDWTSDSLQDLRVVEVYRASNKG